MAFLLLLLALPTCGRRTPRLDEIVLLNENPIGRLDPRFATTTWDLRVAHLLAPGLIGLSDEGLGPTPGLADSFGFVSPLVFEAHLRADGRFPDGRAVDADDVRYTFASLFDPALGSPRRKSLADLIERVETVDARTIRFVLRRPHVSFATELALGILDRRVVQPLDEQIRRANRDGAPPPPLDLVREAVGAGPYQVVERSADRVVLERNPHAAVPARTARLVVRAIRDDNARVLALMGGSGDVILNGVTPMVIETLARRPDLRIAHGPSATVTYLGFNLADPVTGDPEVRRAIAEALNRDKLVAARLAGMAVVAGSLLDRANPFFAASEAWPRFDPASARRRLVGTGRGRPRLVWKTSNLRFRVGLVQAMARQLTEVGFEVEVRPFDFATLLTDVRRGDFQIFSLQMTDVVDPDILRLVFHSSQIPDEQNDFSGLNRFRFRNPEIDGWLDAAAITAEPAARRALYRKVQNAVASSLPMLPLWHEDNVMVFRRDLQDVAVLKTGRLEGLLPAWWR